MEDTYDKQQLEKNKQEIYALRSFLKRQGVDEEQREKEVEQRCNQLEVAYTPPQGAKKEHAHVEKMEKAVKAKPKRKYNKKAKPKPKKEADEVEAFMNTLSILTTTEKAQLFERLKEHLEHERDCLNEALGD